tara:strand:+ start:849 stop:1058 length:210 start_codon:yes stop_codon:yes gene_type:complete
MFNWMNERNKTGSKLRIGVVRHCTFCEKQIKDIEDISYTEDAEITHSKCLQAFEQHWKDRGESLDLMGY